MYWQFIIKVNHFDNPLKEDIIFKSDPKDFNSIEQIKTDIEDYRKKFPDICKNINEKVRKDIIAKWAIIKLEISDILDL